MSRKADTWMPFYVADYLRDTMHLTTEMHGAYMLLLMAAWTRGGRLPNDDLQLAGIAKLAPAQWRRARPVLLPFFTETGDELVQKRLLAESEKAQRLSDARRETGLKGGRPKKQTESEPKPIGFAEHNQTRNLEETPSPSPISEPEGSSVSDANASSVVGTPSDEVAEAVALWNETAGRHNLPKAKTIDRARRAAIKARLADGGLDAWREALAAVERSPHCRGENDRGWRADLDFVCQPKSWRRLLEGSYGGDRAAAPPLEIIFTGPDEVVQAVVRATDPQRAATLLGRCTWRDIPDRALVSTNNVVVDALRSGDCHAALSAIGVRVLLEKAA